MGRIVPAWRCAAGLNLGMGVSTTLGDCQSELLRIMSTTVVTSVVRRSARGVIALLIADLVTIRQCSEVAAVGKGKRGRPIEVLYEAVPRATRATPCAQI